MTVVTNSGCFFHLHPRLRARQWSGFDIRNVPCREFVVRMSNPKLHCNIYLLVVLLLTFANVPAEKGGECQKRTTRRSGIPCALHEGQGFVIARAFGVAGPRNCAFRWPHACGEMQKNSGENCASP